MQGPVASLHIEEVTLGRTKGAKKLYDGLARAAASAKWRLPFTIRGVHVVLRAAPPRNADRAKARSGFKAPKVVHSIIAQVLLRLLPFIPIRVKDVNVHDLVRHLPFCAYHLHKCQIPMSSGMCLHLQLVL